MNTLLTSASNSSVNAPLLSVILVTKNRAKYLDRFLGGLFREIDTDYKNTEVIIIDGASTDGTVDIIRKYEERLAYWVSEPDSGVSEAVNKGLTKAQGEICRLVGDDDELMPDCLHKGVDFLVAHPEVYCVVYHSNWFLEDAEGRRTAFQMFQPSGLRTFKDMLRFPFSGSITPETAYFRRCAFDIGGGYDTSFHLWAYWEMWLRHTKLGLKLYVAPEPILQRLQTPVSDGQVFAKHPCWMQEYYRVLELHGNLYWLLWHKFGGEFTLISPVKHLLRKLFRRIGFAPRAFLKSQLSKLFQQGQS